MRGIFIKSFVVPFYKAFFGFFMLLFIIFGVIIDTRQHLVVAGYILQNTTALSFLITGFLFYALFLVRFQLQLLDKPSYRVFHQSALLSPKIFFQNQFYIWAANHFIIILYALFLSVLSFNLKLWGALILLWMVLLLLYIVHVRLLQNKLKRPLPEKSFAIAKIVWPKSIKVRYPFWFLMHLKEKRPFLLLGSKLFALILFNLFFSSFYSGAYDIRWLRFGILCTAFINFPVWQEKKAFERQKLPNFLNLPLSITRKTKLHSYSTLAILAPEFTFIFYQYFRFEDEGEWLSLVFLIFALNLGVYGLINNVRDSSILSTYAVATFFLLFITILFGIPDIMISIICLILFLQSIYSAYRN